MSLTVSDAWECDESGKLGDVPDWIEQGITPCQVAAIVQGGCASGAYMPAVTYWQASHAMGNHGDAVLDYIDGHELKAPLIDGESWSGYACKILSTAVELWASAALDEYMQAE